MSKLTVVFTSDWTSSCKAEFSDILLWLNFYMYHLFNPQKMFCLSRYIESQLFLSVMQGNYTFDVPDGHKLLITPGISGWCLMYQLYMVSVFANLKLSWWFSIQLYNYFTKHTCSDLYGLHDNFCFLLVIQFTIKLLILI